MDHVTGLRLLKSFTLDPDTGALGVVQRMVNASPNPARQQLHDRTLCPAGGFFLLPLPKQSRHRAGWAVLWTTEAGSAFDGQQPAAPNVAVFGDLLVAQAAGVPGKLGSDTDVGGVAHVRGRLLFVKFFKTWRGAELAGAGHTTEFSWNEQMAALELFSPLANVQPAQAFDFPELWQLIELKEPVQTFEDARAVARKVPPSPFGPTSTREVRPRAVPQHGDMQKQVATAGGLGYIQACDHRIRVQAGRRPNLQLRGGHRARFPSSLRQGGASLLNQAGFPKMRVVPAFFGGVPPLPGRAGREENH